MTHFKSIHIYLETVWVRLFSELTLTEYIVLKLEVLTKDLL